MLNIHILFSLNHFFLVFFVLLTLFLLFIVVFGLFFSNNILITYMACELFLILILFFFFFSTPFWFLIKLQTYLLLILGLIAAEMAIGLLLFVRFYKSTKTLVWSEIFLGK